MFALRALSVLLVFALGLPLGAPGPAFARSVGQVIDDTGIATRVKAKLVADKLSNLTHVTVQVREAVVTLGGDVDSVERRDRAVGIASAVSGVKSVVDNIRVGESTTAATTSPPPPEPPSTVTTVPSTAVPSLIDVNGIVARVDARAGTITLEDGRVIRTSNGTVIWQPVPIGTLRPGAEILVRGVQPVAAR